MASYNGVAILSKKKAKNVLVLTFAKNDARHLSMEIKGMEIISVWFQQEERTQK